MGGRLDKGYLSRESLTLRHGDTFRKKQNSGIVILYIAVEASKGVHLCFGSQGRDDDSRPRVSAIDRLRNRFLFGWNDWLSVGAGSMDAETQEFAVQV